AGRIQAVLSHEMAHVRRCDWLMQMFAEIFRAIYLFNPLAWIVCARLCRESEQACDDIVLSHGISAVDYARHLLDIASRIHVRHTAWSHAVLMARQSTLKRRFAAIHSPSTNRDTVSRTTLAACALVVVAVIVPSAAIRGSERLTVLPVSLNLSELPLSLIP